jgi:SagB-type dehydrogenase family enzyme
MDSPSSLPPARRHGGASLTEALDLRRSCREFTDEPLSPEAVGQCLWAAQGLNVHGRRTSPSAGGLFPLEVYAVTAGGVHRYEPGHHRLVRHLRNDLRESLARAALNQTYIAVAPLTIVLCAVFARIEVRYGKKRGERYTLIEVGHSAQNVLLQAQALGLGSVPVGAFQDAEVMALLELPAEHVPLYMIPIGHPGPGA